MHCTLSMCTIKSGHLSAYPLNLSSLPNLSIHSLNPSSQPTLSIHPQPPHNHPFPTGPTPSTGPNGYHISPQCLETLRYSEFHAKMMKKLQQKAGDSDIKTTEKNAHENVFRQLMQKIKSLEMNYAIIDMYSAQVSK